MSTQDTRICPNCKKTVSLQYTECPYCGIIFKKYTKYRPIKSFYSASYNDVAILEQIKTQLQSFNKLSLVEKTALIAKARKYGFLDVVARHVKDPTDRQILLNLSKVSLVHKKGLTLSKPQLFVLSFILAGLLALVILR